MFSDELLKTLAEDGGSEQRGLQSFKHVILFFFGMGTMVDFLKHAGTTDRERDTAWYAIRAHGFTDVHPFEGSSYICDRKGEWTDLFCCSHVSALCVGGVISLETSIKSVELVW